MAIYYNTRTNVLVLFKVIMSSVKTLYDKIVKQNNRANISFRLLCELLISLGFSQRVSGDHFIFTMDDVDEIINIQPNGSKAMPYQVKQVRDIIIKYKLGGKWQ